MRLHVIVPKIDKKYSAFAVLDWEVCSVSRHLLHIFFKQPYRSVVSDTDIHLIFEELVTCQILSLWHGNLYMVCLMSSITYFFQPTYRSMVSDTNCHTFSHTLEYHYISLLGQSFLSLFGKKNSTTHSIVNRMLFY